MFEQEQDEAEEDTCALEKEQHHMLVEAQVHDDRDQDMEGSVTGSGEMQDGCQHLHTHGGSLSSTPF